MLRYTSRDGTDLAIRYSRSLTHYSESYLHVQTDVPHLLNKFHLIVVFFAFFGESLVLAMGIAVYPNYFDSIYGVLGISALFSVSPLVTTICNPLSTYFVDHKGPKYPLLIGLILILLSSSILSYGLSLHEHKPAGFGLTLIGMCLHGASSPLIIRGGFSLVTMCHAEAVRATAFRIAYSGSVIGTIVGPVLGGGFYVAANAWTPFMLVSILFGVVLVLALLMHKGGHATLVSEMDDGEDVKVNLLGQDEFGGSPLDVSSFLDLLDNKHMRICAGACVLGSSAVGILAPLLPTYMRQKFDLDPAAQGAFFAVIALTAYLSSPFVASVSDMSSSYATTRSMASGGPSSPRYNAVFAGITIIGMSLCGLVWAVRIYWLFFVLVGVGIGQTLLYTPSMPLIADIAEWKGYEDHGSATVVTEASVGLGLTIGPIIAGAIQLLAGGGTKGFAVACFVIGLGCVMYSVAVLNLRGLGKRLGEDALELDGSLYGRKSLDVTDGMGGNLQQRHFREYSGVSEDSAVF